MHQLHTGSMASGLLKTVLLCDNGLRTTYNFVREVQQVVMIAFHNTSRDASPWGDLKKDTQPIKEERKEEENAQYTAGFKPMISGS